jgi:DNA-binding NarL/FixJ family response regulator
MSDSQIALFLADDNQMVIEGIKALVANTPEIQVVGHCNNGLEVIEKVTAARPDVLVLDISLPGINGLNLCRMVKEKIPATAVIMLSMNASERIVMGALRNGANGYLTKESVSREFCGAIRTVFNGETYLAPGISKAVLEGAGR